MAALHLITYLNFNFISQQQDSITIVINNVYKIKNSKKKFEIDFSIANSSGNDRIFFFLKSKKKKVKIVKEIRITL